MTNVLSAVECVAEAWVSELRLGCLVRSTAVIVQRHVAYDLQHVDKLCGNPHSSARRRDALIDQGVVCDDPDDGTVRGLREQGNARRRLVRCDRE